MVCYSRKNRHLIIIPEIPKWFIVDNIGQKIIKMIEEKKTLQQVLGEFSENSYNEISETYNQLTEIINFKPEQQISTESSLTSVTTIAMINITKKCNLQCPHCYVDANNQKVLELTFDEHKLISQSLKPLLSKNKHVKHKINLTGGEPFIHNEILEIIKIYRDANFSVNISSNGLLIDKKEIDFLYSNNVSIMISLDGSSKDTHEKIRGKDTFSKTISIIEKLAKSNVKVGINTLIHEKNIHELDKLITLAYNLGCHGFNPINLVQLGRACDSKLKRASEKQIFKITAKHLEKYPEHLNLFRNSSLFSSLGSAVLAGISCRNCGIGDRPCIYISEIGNIFPCANTQKEEFKLGNLREESIEECLSNHKILNKFRELDVDTLNEKCSVCHVRKFCGGDCRGETYNVTENLRAPYVACEDRKNSLIELMWITAKNPHFFENRAKEYIQNTHRN